MKENFALECKALKNSLRTTKLPGEKSLFKENPENTKLILSNALEIYIELVAEFKTSENFNSFKAKLKLAQ